MPPTRRRHPSTLASPRRCEKCNCVSSTSVAPLTSLEATREDVKERVKRGMLKEEWWSDVWVAGDNLRH